jgi:hypothetical protein
MSEKIAGATVRLGLSNLYSSMCTHVYVLQRCVHRAAVRRAAPSRGRCRKPGAVKTQAPHAGGGLGKGRLKLGRSLGARRASLCGVGRRGVEPQERLLSWYACEHLFLRRAGYRYRQCAVVTLPLRLCVGRGCGASASTPGCSAQAHTPPRSVRVDAPILPCLRGGSQKYSGHAPRAENLTARGVPLAVRACGR